MVGKGCNEAKLNVVSELLNPHLSFIHGQKKKKKKKKERKLYKEAKATVHSLNLWM